MNQINPTEYLGVNQIKAEFPFLNPGTLANLRCRKQGPRYFKLGQKVLYRRSDLMAWFESEPVLTHDSVQERG